MKRLFTTAIVLLSAAAVLGAQELKTGYFLDHYSYAYRINPAAPINDDPYTFFMLGIGNTTASLGSNLGPSTLFHKAGSTWYAFTDTDNYTAALVDKRLNLNKISSMRAGVDLNILTFGKQNANNRITVELNSKTNARLAIPNSVFHILRLAGTEQDKEYSFKDLSVNVQSYAELAVGYTHQINDMIAVGGRIKGLAGLANAGVTLDVYGRKSKVEGKDMYLDLVADANMSYPLPYVFPTYVKDGQDYLDYDNIGSIDFGGLLKQKMTLPGLGAAIDLGVNITPFDGLTIDVSLLDLGFISWKENIRVGGETHSDVETTLDDILPDDWKVQTGGRHVEMLDFNVHVGAKYKMPFYDRLSVGLLGTFQNNYVEGRLGVDVTPLDWLSIALSTSYGSYGFDLGTALNIHCKGINFFVGIDSYPGVGFGLNGEPSTFPVGAVLAGFGLVNPTDPFAKQRMPTLRINTAASFGLLVSF